MGFNLLNPARLVRDPFDREDGLFELKWDGFRAIGETDHSGGVKLYSRQHSDFKKPRPGNLWVTDGFEQWSVAQVARTV